MLEPVPHAVVTGGGRGIGRAIAAALKASGVSVSIVGRDRRVLDETVAAGDADRAALLDVTDEAAVRATFADLAAERPFDIVVANAGAAETGPFLRSDAQRFRRMLDVNLIGTVNVFQAALPGMIERRHGRLIAIASTAAHRGYAYVSAYVAAKHAVLGLVKSLALETAATGVTVNAVSPGYADTEMVGRAVQTIKDKAGLDEAAALAQLVKDNPQRRLIAPAEVARAVLYLCGEHSGAITGQSLLLNGGEF